MKYACTAFVAIGALMTISPAAAASPSPSTLWPVCRLREAQIIQYVEALNKANQALTSEKNRQQQDKIVANIGALNRGLEASEQSWQRLDCSRLLYPTPQYQGR